MRPSILEYKKYRYFKVAIFLMALAIMAYLFHQPATGEYAYGSSWLGYLFGILSTLIVITQLFYGVRKRLAPMHAEQRAAPALLKPQQDIQDRRRVDSNWLRNHGATLQGWLSAHAYLGIALVVLVTLHTGFQFGRDVHTLAYALMMAVIISGCYGVYAYLRFPRLMTANFGGRDTFDALLLEIGNLDKLAETKSLEFSDEICTLVLKAKEETQIGGNLFQQLSAFRWNCPTSFAVRQLRVLGKNLKYDQLKSFDDLYIIMVQKETLVKQARRDVMYRARMAIWLYLHVPFSIAFLAALVAHIVAIFYFW